MKQSMVICVALASAAGMVARAADFASVLPAHGAGRERWDVFGSFGVADGHVTDRSEGYALVRDAYRLETRVERGIGGVEVVRTTLTNTSKESIRATCLMSRFALPEGEYEAYTQNNTWQQESRGGWQTLVSAATARGGAMRTCFGAAPMMALWNVQCGRGRVFHVLSDGAWEIHAAREPSGGENSRVVVTAGFDARHLDWSLKPGESVELPQVLTYGFANRTDLDCHKLHAYWNARYPKSSVPALYNSWMCRFDKLDADHVLKQVACAKRLGLDYFVLDAGWFGMRRDWGRNRGDWSERPDGALNGRMAEISKAVRDAGMKFGFWLEAESAHPESDVVKAHPDWFVGRGGERFLDFRNPAAFSNLLETTCALLSKYKASFVKFDFNQDARLDATGLDFAAYNAGYRAFVRAVRRRNPGVYLEGCASGGLMMELGWARDFDSFWLSDNQSPYHGLRIVKDTMLRLPPRLIERWVVAYSDRSRQPDYGGATERILATDDGTWTNVRSVSRDVLDAFTLGGTLGFSCDLTALSENEQRHVADLIARRRAEGAFWANVVGRILCDTPEMLALQYSDAALSDVRLVAVAGRIRQGAITLFPALDPAAHYEVDGKVRTAADLAAHGVTLGVSNHRAAFKRLRRVRP